MRPQKTYARRALSLAVILSAYGCSSLQEKYMPEDPARLPGGPDYVRWIPRDYHAEPLPATAEAAGQKPPSIKPPVPEADRLERPKQDWWAEFGSEELNELIDTALVNNYDLRVAVARIEQAENQARIVDAARVPNIQFFGGIESRGPAEGVGTATSRKDWHSRGIYQFGLRANYEVDLWGRLGYETQSALEQARASVFAREVVALTLIAETSITYFQYLSLSERITVAENNLKLARDVAEAISRRLQRGDASKIEQQQQLIAISLIENNLANIKLERERVLTRLAVFLGKPPGMIQIRNQSLKGIHLPVVRPSLPSELLCRRPDIRRAEAQLASASADVNAARANLLPSVALTGQFGQGSFKLTELLSPQSILYSLAGNLVADIFDGERKENRVTQARAHNRELLEQYASAVLGALRDVEDALTGIRLTGLQQQALAEALARNSKLLEMSHQSFKLGAMDLISFLDVQRNVYQAQDSEASARLEQARSAVDLFKALGGGVSEQQGDPCATPTQIAADLQAGAKRVRPATESTVSPQAGEPAKPTAAPAEPAAAQQPDTQAAPTTTQETPPASAAKTTPAKRPEAPVSEAPASPSDKRPNAPLRPAGRITGSAAAEAAAAQAEKEAEAAARRPNGK